MFTFVVEAVDEPRWMAPAGVEVRVLSRTEHVWPDGTKIYGPPEWRPLDCSGAGAVLPRFTSELVVSGARPVLG